MAEGSTRAGVTAVRGLCLAILLTALMAPAFGGDDTPVIPAHRQIAPGALHCVEGDLTLTYHGEARARDFRADRTITFLFAKPFKLKLTSSGTGLVVCIGEKHALIYDPVMKRVIEVEAKALMGNRWLRYLVSMLDFGSLIDPEKLAKVSTDFSVEVHLGEPPPRVHGVKWKPTPPPGRAKGSVEAGDWVILTPAKGGLYDTFLDIGRIALRIGHEHGLPREFRYYENTPNGGFGHTLTVAIPRLAFNESRAEADYGCSYPPETAKVNGTEFLASIIIERMYFFWKRFQALCVKLGTHLLPDTKGR